MLNIHVCVKQSIDINSLEYDPDTLRPRLETLQFRIGDADLCAVEEAVRIKENNGGKVTLLCAGHNINPDIIREAMAIGADDAYVVSDPLVRDADQWFYANVLAALSVLAGQPDIILCGESSLDDSAYQVGPRIAEELDLPSITHVTRLEVKERKIIAERAIEDGVEILEVELPVVVSVGLEINTPRLPSLLMIRAASRKNVNFIPLDAIKLPKEKLSSLVKYCDIKAIKVGRKNVVLSGSLEEIASMLLSVLKSDGVIQ